MALAGVTVVVSPRLSAHVRRDNQTSSEPESDQQQCRCDPDYLDPS
jgi:hypothetical protein